MGGEQNPEQRQQVKAVLARAEDYLSLRVRRERRLTVQKLLEGGAEAMPSEDWAKLRFERGLIDAYERNYREAIALWDSSALTGAMDASQRPAEGTERDANATTSTTLGLYEAAIAAYEHSSPGDPAEGAVLGLLNRYPEAIAAFSQVLTAHPDDSGTWYNKSVTLRKLGREQAALSAFDAALTLEPNAVKAHYGKAMLLCSLGRHGRAAAAWDRLLTLQPSRIEALFAQGLSLTYLGQYREAIAAIGEVLDLGPEDQEVLQDQGYAFHRLRRYQDAVEAYANALDFRQDYRGVNHRETSYPSFVRQQLVRLRATVVSGADQADIDQSSTDQFASSQAEAPNADAADIVDTVAPDDNPFEANSLAAVPDKPELPLLVEQLKPSSNEPNDLKHQAEPDEAAIAPQGAAFDTGSETPTVAYSEPEEAIAEALESADEVEEANQATSPAAQSEQDKAAAEGKPDAANANSAAASAAIVTQPLASKGDCETRYNQGNALARQGHYEDAIATYDLVLAAQPDYRFALYNKACCYALWGKAERALAQLEEAIALHPPYADVAKADEDLASLWSRDRFKTITGQRTPTAQAN